ncbi:uncharacterized protein PAC_00230 [Phialocephala subalpina]|uniref:gluconokinase n=1 Tax=Phialocephala subalpina TaxID=576137 RepID=A0A1L7WC74_9HELO|nr:uncharacterized protein PAC_00230 [Phialocephala subalpina]
MSAHPLASLVLLHAIFILCLETDFPLFKMTNPHRVIHLQYIKANEDSSLAATSSGRPSLAQHLPNFKPLHNSLTSTRVESQPPTTRHRLRSTFFDHNFHAGHSPALHVALMRNLVVLCDPAGCGKSTVGEYLAQEKGCLFLEGDDYHPQENRDKMHAGISLTDDDRAGWLETLAAACITGLATKPLVIVSCSALKQKYRQVFRAAISFAALTRASSQISLKALTTTLTTPRKLSLTTPRKLSLKTLCEASITTPRKLSLATTIRTTCTTTAVIATATVTAIVKNDQIKLDFIFLSMSEKKAKNLVRVREFSTGHFMPATLVSSQFEILELPGEKEVDAHVFDSNVGVEEVKRGAFKVLEGLITKD